MLKFNTENVNVCGVVESIIFIKLDAWERQYINFNHVYIKQFFIELQLIVVDEYLNDESFVYSCHVSCFKYEPIKQHLQLKGFFFV